MARLFLINALVLILLVALVEGLASLLVVGKWIRDMQPVAERVHTHYDALLGWVNTPGTVIRDLYGPGADVRINSQGLREDGDIPAAIAPGTRRAVCLGDSFTFGFGVRNDDGWCHLLPRLAPGLETVNMGLGGYGLDQVYLWYQRDGGAIKHDLLIVAVVSDDIARMHWDEFLGYPKPKLEVSGGTLVTRNTPVPRSLIPFGTLKYRMPIGDLGVLRLYHALWPDEGARDLSVDRAQFRGVLIKVMEGFRTLAQERGSRVVLVYLPSAPDFEPDGSTSWYLPDLRGAAVQAGVPFVELLSEFAAMPRDQLIELFIAPGTMTFAGADAHYNESGNKVVAALLYQKLLAIDGVAPLLRPVDRRP